MYRGGGKGGPGGGRQYDYEPKRRVGQKSLDPYTCLINEVSSRGLRSKYDRVAIQPHDFHSKDMLPSNRLREIPISAVTPKWLHTIYWVDQAQNRGERQRKACFSALCWTPEGRRLITGNSRGEFTLWHGTGLSSESRQLGHEDAKIASMKWCEQADFMLTADDRGQVCYWARNMNRLKAFDATHNSSKIRELSISPTASKFSCCSEDGIIRIHDTKTATKV